MTYELDENDIARRPKLEEALQTPPTRATAHPGVDPSDVFHVFLHGVRGKLFACVIGADPGVEDCFVGQRETRPLTPLVIALALAAWRDREFPNAPRWPFLLGVWKEPEPEATTAQGCRVWFKVQDAATRTRLLQQLSEEHAYLKKIDDRITKDPAVLDGKPCIRGTRISVQQVLAALNTKCTVAEIVTSYPNLTQEDVEACFDYYDEDRIKPESKLVVSRCRSFRCRDCSERAEYFDEFDTFGCLTCDQWLDLHTPEDCPGCPFPMPTGKPREEQARIFEAEDLKRFESRPQPTPEEKAQTKVDIERITADMRASRAWAALDPFARHQVDVEENLHLESPENVAMIRAAVKIAAARLVATDDPKRSKELLDEAIAMGAKERVDE